LLVRVSATDWHQGGLAIDDVVAIAQQLSARGVDLIDCSAGGVIPGNPQSTGPGYQVPFAQRIRQDAGLPTAAVGLITAPEQADQVIRNGRADLVALGRELLRNPYWPLEAGRLLGYDVHWPRQYRRARPA
jgi:2,4-dienoyl-CoA reductase-like NADH-dependent reductase (Old Yellow Enzyme family)